VRILFEGRDLVELLAQLDPLLVVEVGRDVDELLGLLLNGADHLGVAVAGGANGNSGGEVEEVIVVHVPHVRALAVVHHKGVVTRVRGRDGNRIALQNCPRLGPRHVEFLDFGRLRDDRHRLLI
jgi:hypothetical protein